MLHVQQGQWSSSFASQAASMHPSDRMFGEATFSPHTSLGAFGQDRYAPSNPNQTSFNGSGNGLDTTHLSQRLGSLLFDIQSGGDQVQSVWQMWHNDESSQDNVPFGVLDKPQTAAPPVTPPNAQWEFDGVKNGYNPQKMHPAPDAMRDKNFTISSLSFEGMSLGKDA